MAEGHSEPEFSHWSSLPSELQLSILRKVPLSRQKLQLHLTSKAWSELLANPNAHDFEIDWEQGCVVLAGTRAAAARAWLSPVRSLRLVSPQRKLKQSYIMFSSERTDQLALSCLPRSLSRLALCQYDQLNAQLLPRTVTTLQLIDCELPKDLDDSLKNVRQLELQLLMPLNRIFRSSKPELRTLKLDCSLLGRSHEPVLQPLLPLSAEYLPCLEYLELCNVGIPKGNFALHLSSLCIQLSEFSSLRRVEISAYVPAPEWVSGVPRLVSSIRSSLPAGCAFLVHALADPG